MKNKSAKIFLLLFLVVTSAFADSNLTHHPSPYIRLHANDALNWQLWDQSVMDRAKKENKLIFISVGYYACHWCHVMRKESFSNKAIGDFINANFIAVKIDRELNSALDNYLMTFLRNTQGHGGWPLNVFVTPDGYPLVGMTYKPAKQFKDFLIKLNTQWALKNKQFNLLAKQAFDFSNSKNRKLIKLVAAEKLTETFMSQLRQSADEFMGGLGYQAKFPRPTMLLVMLDLYKQNHDKWLREFITLTLDQMMTGGLHDVVSGGFFRYTVDPDWQTPHFEKMLYTNAGLIHVYLEAYKLFNNEKYLQTAIETTGFIIRDMKVQQGGFASSINAQDKQGVEGGGYIWNKAELEKILNVQQIKKIKTHWTYIKTDDKNKVFPVGLAATKDWDIIKQILREQKKTSAHELDDKSLPSWNAYVLSALAKIAKVSGRKDFKQQGQALYLHLIQQAENGLQRPGVGKHKYLEDFAFVAQGLLDWQTEVLLSSEVNKEQTQLIKNLLNDALELFVSSSGWRLSDRSLLPLPSDQFNLPDAQLPASDVVVLNLLHRLGYAKDKAQTLLINSRAAYLDANVATSPVDFASQIQYQQKLTR